MKIDYTAQFWKEGNHFIAHAMPLDVMSSAETMEGARQALDEAVQVFIKTAIDIGTLDEILEEVGYVKQNDRWICPPLLSLEKQSTAIAL